MALDKKLQSLLDKTIKRTDQKVISSGLKDLVGAQKDYTDKYFRFGDAADQYITENPTAGYDIIDPELGKVTGRQAASRDFGAFGNLAYGIVSPFMNLGQIAGDVATGADKGNTLLGEAEKTRFDDNPLLFGGQQLLGAGATLLPVGGAATLVGQAGRGALAGALSGASQTDLTKEGADIVGDALMGGVAGGALTGALGLAGKGIQKARAGRFEKQIGAGTRSAMKGAFNEADNFLTNAEKLNSLMKTKQTLNNNQLKGLQQQYRGLGFTTRKGDPNFAKTFADDVLKVEKAREFFGTPRSTEGLSQLFDKTATLREGLLDSSQKTFTASLDDVSKIGAKKVSLATNNALTPQDAAGAIRNRLDEVLSSVGFDPYDITQSAVQKGKVPLRAGDLQVIKYQVTDGFLNVAKKGSKAADDMVDAQIYQWANQQLQTVPGYKPLNEVMEVLYTQNPGLRRTADTGLLGMQSASVMRTPGSIALGALEKGQGRIREGLGNIQARLGGGAADIATGAPIAAKSGNQYNAILEGITQKAPKEQQAGLIQQLANQLPGAAASGDDLARSMIGTIDRLYGIRPRGTLGSALQMGVRGAQQLAPVVAAQIAAGGVPAQQMPMQEQETDTLDQGADLASLLREQRMPGLTMQEALMQASTMRGGKMDGSTVTLAKALMEEGGGGKALPVERIQQISDMNNALSELDNLRNIVQDKGSYFGAVQGSALGDVAQGLGLGGERAMIGTLTNTLAQTLGKALEGGKLTDADIERYRSMLPTLRDNPNDALQKLNQIQLQLRNQLTNQLGALQSSGYDISGLSSGGMAYNLGL